MVADPGATSKRLQELVDACLKANEAILAAAEARQKLDEARKLHDERLRSEWQGHLQKIAKANAEITSRDQTVNSQLAERERAVKQLETRAAADADAASQLRADLERRLESIKRAAA